jgi:cytochrome c peroxidase
MGRRVQPATIQQEQFFANNGLDLIYEDNGHGVVSGIESDNGVFKIPQLRNVALTYPYMHDGRFETLEEVVEFYSNAIQAHDNLDHRLRNPDLTPVRMKFNNEEKTALVAFLESLSDMSMVGHQKFSDPWR